MMHKLDPRLNFFLMYGIENLSRGLPFIIASKSLCLSKIKYLILSFVDTYMYQRPLITTDHRLFVPVIPGAAALLFTMFYSVFDHFGRRERNCSESHLIHPPAKEERHWRNLCYLVILTSSLYLYSSPFSLSLFIKDGYSNGRIKIKPTWKTLDLNWMFYKSFHLRTC